MIMENKSNQIYMFFRKHLVIFMATYISVASWENLSSAACELRMSRPACASAQIGQGMYRSLFRI